jgi:hypothetical protein
MSRIAWCHRSSNSRRTAATPGLRGDSAHRSSQSSHSVSRFGSAPGWPGAGNKVIAIIAASCAAAVGISASRSTPSAYQESSE